MDFLYTNVPLEYSRAYHRAKSVPAHRPHTLHHKGDWRMLTPPFVVKDFC